jgi:MFS family permease
MDEQKVIARVGGGRRAGFIAAALALAVAMMGTTIPTPLYPLYRQQFGFSELMITVIFASYAAGVIASLSLFGHLSDDIGRRPVLLSALGVAALGAGCFLATDGLPLLLIGRILFGLSAGVFTGTATATLIDFAAPGRRARSTLVATAANMGGLGLGPLVAGLLAQWAGSPLRLVFWIYLVLLAVASIGVWAMPETVQSRTRPDLHVRLVRVPRELRTLFIDASIAAFAGYAVIGLFTAVAPAVLGEDLGVTSPAAVGAIVFSVFAASTAGQTVVGALGQDVSLRAGCAGLIAAMGLLALSLGFSSLALLIVAAVVSGLGHGMGFRAGLAGLNESAPSGLRAQIASSYFVVAYLGIAIPAIGVGVLTELIGLRTAAYVFAAAVAVISAVGLGLLARARRPAGTPAESQRNQLATEPAKRETAVAS